MCAGAFGGQTESVNLSLTAIGKEYGVVVQSENQAIIQSANRICVGIIQSVQ